MVTLIGDYCQFSKPCVWCGRFKKKGRQPFDKTDPISPPGYERKIDAGGSVNKRKI
jgi:hypothetical protein